MASFKARNNRKYRGVKWIDAPFAYSFRRQCAARSLMVRAMHAGIAASASANIGLIRQSNATKIEKAMAIANMVISTHQATAKTYGTYGRFSKLV